MKIVHINKTDAGGGAAVAALRIHRALLRSGIDSHFVVQEQKRKEINEHHTSNSLWCRTMNFMRFVCERLTILPHEKEASLRYNFSIANTGQDITTMPVVKEADVIHLHWVNQGFLSLNDIKRLFSMGKPVIWTLHDMWPFTGGCHYAGTCLEFNEKCGYCPFLKRPAKNDISTKVFNMKKQIYSKVNLTIVSCSHWLCTLTKGSTLFRNTPAFTIPNPIDTNFYNLLNKEQCRMDLGLPTDKKLILFGAAKITDVRKGFRYLEEALQILKDNFPAFSNEIELIVFGKLNNSSKKRFAFKTHNLKFISDPKTLVKLYNAADTFVLPSLQDNLPNTVVESMSCGTPVVGFRIGGVPEMIEHMKTGYLAEVKNSLSLANGIYNMLLSGGDEQRQMVRNSAIKMFSEKIVAQQYISVYGKAISR